MMKKTLEEQRQMTPEQKLEYSREMNKARQQRYRQVHHKEDNEYKRTKIAEAMKEEPEKYRKLNVINNRNYRKREAEKRGEVLEDLNKKREVINTILTNIPDKVRDRKNQVFRARMKQKIQDKKNKANVNKNEALDILRDILNDIIDTVPKQQKKKEATAIAKSIITDILNVDVADGIRTRAIARKRASFMKEQEEKEKTIMAQQILENILDNVPKISALNQAKKKASGKK